MAPAGRGSSAARTPAPARRGSSAALAALEAGLAGGEASASKLFVVSVGDGTGECRIAMCGGVVQEPPAAETGIKSVGSSPSWEKEDDVKREGLPSLWVKFCSSGGGEFVSPPPSRGGGGS